MNRWIFAWLLLSLVVGAAVAQDASVTPISAIDDESGSEVNLESQSPAASADAASTEAAPAAAAASSAQALAYVFGLEKGFPFVQIQFLQRGQRGVPRSQSRRRLQNAPTASAAVSRPALRVVLHSIAELNDTNGEPGWQEGETLLQNITLNLANLERDRINDNAAQLAAQPQFRLANGNSSGISVAWLAALDLQPQASNASSNASASSNTTTGTSSGSALQSVLPSNSNLAGKFQRGDLWIGLWINNFTYTAPSSLACVQYALVGSQPFVQQNTTGGNATVTDATLRTVAQVLGNHSVILTINGTAAPAATNPTAETGNATSTASQPAAASPGALVYAWSDNYLANFTLPSGNQTAAPAGAGKPVIASISPVTAAAEVAALGLDIRSSEHVALLRACFAERDTTLIWSSLLGFRGAQAESGF